jgi:two-component system CheB/CheR fusion protein
MAAKPVSFPIVGIGASAGGLEAFKDLLRFLPDDAGMAYVLVQHLDPKHESLLPDLLARATRMPVHEAREGMKVRADHVYVMAPNTDMTLSQGALTLLPRTQDHGQHLSIDRFLRSLAESRASGAIGVILSGTAADGTLGLQAIKAEGGMTFAQDPTSAQFDGMPQSAIAAGCVDFVGSPQDIARELTRISRHPYLRQPPEEEAEEEAALPGQEGAGREPEFQQILRLLRRRTDTDFSAYKPTTLKRRWMRRMALWQIDSLAGYLTYLSDHQAEVEALYQDMLVGVTSFFRDPSTFQTLEGEILPRLVATKAAGSSIRMWVPGCSTGEEVYSLAICLLEFLAERSLSTAIQLFGTDLNAKAIAYARTGLYPPGALGALSPARLDHFFQPTGGSYQIQKAVRDLCVFAQHNLLKDPPFSRLDLLSCQNVLIYLGSVAQKKVIQSFHYALAPHGVLLLGPSETIGAASDLFAPAGKHKRQLYVKKATSIRPLVVGNGRRSARGTPPVDESEEESIMVYEEEQREFDLQHETDRLLANLAPASVVIDAQMEILHFRGDTDPYLGPAPGRASLNLFKMARAGLDMALRTLLSKARKNGQPVKHEGIQVSDHGVLRDIAVEVIPVKASATERYFVILFEETPAPSTTSTISLVPENRQQGSAARREVKDRRIRQLERELESTREEMRSMIEELEAANEELHSANEESLSNNEELQSLNEELETSKEEIQASNEELLVVNAELQLRTAQAQEARDFAEAIVETIREPLLVLDANLRVQRANHAFYQCFQAEPADTEHRRIFELGDGHWNIPVLRTLLEELLPTNHSFVDYEVDHTFPSIGRKIMLLNAQRIDHVPLILLAMEDITQRKRAEMEKQHLLVQREEFMAIASHELKTPVTSLKGFTQVLHSRFTKAGDERSAALLAKMNGQLDKLIHLIRELLDVTSIEAGKLSWHTEQFDLDALVRDIVEEVDHTTDQHQIRIEGAAPTRVSGDRERIGQVLTNLLTNAIKYSPQAHTILVKCAADTESATVSVQDFGIGIAPDKHEHVFERFFRVSDQEHETFPGLGLGLFISAQIVQRQGGRMWVESRVGAGSTFFFTVPCAPQPEPGSQGQAVGEEQHA